MLKNNRNYWLLLGVAVALCAATLASNIMRQIRKYCAGLFPEMRVIDTLFKTRLMANA